MSSKLSRMESVRRLQKMQSESDGMLSFTQKLVACLAGGGVVCMYCLICVAALASLALGIAKIAMGSLYFNTCPVEPMVPVYLIVGALVSLTFNCVCRPSKNETGETSISCKGCAAIFGLVVCLFTISWLAAGTVFVFRAYDRIDTCQSALTTPSTANVTTPASPCPSCDGRLLGFAYGVVIAEWCFTAIALLLVSCLYCSFCLAKCTTPRGVTELA